MRIATPLAFFLFVASTLNAQKYTVFDVPGEAYLFTQAISASGDVVGVSGIFGSTQEHLWLRKADGTFTLFDPARPMFLCRQLLA